MTTITKISHDLFAVHNEGKLIAKASAHALSAIDGDITDTVARAQDNPGQAIVVPGLSKVPAPRHSRIYSGIIQ